MKTTRILAAALAVSLAFGAAAQTSQKLSAGKANDYGLIYSLPVTGLDIYIEAELNEEHPGEFHNYAKGTSESTTPSPRTSCRPDCAAS